MRIIAGEFRRRVLVTPRDKSITRPIPDRVKESLFSLLRGHCEGANVFDGFSGTGAIGLEAVSRGAARCLLVERDRAIFPILKENVESLGCEDRCTVLQGDALGAAALASAPRPLTLAFLDPPYPMVLDPTGFKRVMAQVAALVNILAPGGYVVLRTPWPLQHEEVAVAAEAVDPSSTPRDRSRKDKRSQVKKERSWRRHADSMDPKRAKEHLSGEQSRRSSQPPSSTREEGDSKPDPLLVHADALDEIDAKLAAAEAQLLLPVRKRIEVDLTLPNAIGPETHTYTTMAVHLYTRKPA